jgi:hypothetical protein
MICPQIALWLFKTRILTIYFHGVFAFYNEVFRDGRYVQQVFKEYIAYYYPDRPHQGIGQHIPDRYDLPGSKQTGGRIRSRTIPSGLDHTNSWVT